MKKIMICGVPNSNNLGDRVIIESMNYIYEQYLNKYEIVNFDIVSGKIYNGNLDVKIKLNSNGFRKKMIPNILRRMKVYSNYKKNEKLNLELENIISKQDCVVIGGGHLLIDNYLHFPLAINQIVQLAKEYQIPVIIAFVGAKGKWSQRAKKLLVDSLDYAKCISVRDSASKDFLVSINSKYKEKTQVISDPALFVKDFVGISDKNKMNIGIGIMDPNEIARHAKIKWSRDEAAGWWKKIITDLEKKDLRVNIFTNGAPTDNAFVEYYIKPHFEKNNNVKIMEYPKNYKELIQNIERQDAVIAQRLHACLPSISFENKTFGVIWDEKVEGVFNELGMSEYLIDFRIAPNSLIKKIESSLANGTRLEKEIINKINLKKVEMKEYLYNYT
ncbi:polysaccharide pyruvyl transferase family protein [Oceanobacillus sojae]|uniref:polysaccharide pyruvyl transferase family protein n=1 Tax=Oceanobacillus sojae TaxID=582851 RepID=UPI0021A33DF6|nr:polysaccharide pyruvyl transferase family protein [Oceanobacillus sojae]MCT1901859.1 polysaccharide pyruvyl transferase family protein [Oceanobacillus sojae]